MNLAQEAAVYAATLLSLSACGHDGRSNVGEAPDAGGVTESGHDAGSHITSTAPHSAPGAAPATGTVQLAACGASNAAGLGQADVQKLMQGGAATGMRFLYPYEGTVFPRGLAAPLLMWEGRVEAQAVYIHLHSKGFRYQGCLKADAPGRVTFPQEVWDAASEQSTGKSDPLQLELTVFQNGKVWGPIREHIIIAPGRLKGSVFYNSYSSQLAKQAGAAGGAVLRIPAGGKAEVFLGKQSCTGCHGVSADGSRLVTNQAVHELTPETHSEPAPLRTASTSFPGLTPDGTLFAQGGKLQETDTGLVVNAGLPAAANQVAFSADGRWATFLDGAGTSAAAAGGENFWISLNWNVNLENSGKLALMRFDPTARTFSDYRLFKNVSSSAEWPQLTPDSKAIVFVDSATDDLMLLDVGSGTVTLLAQAMGFRSAADAQAGKSYLPFASQGEARKAYFPTIAPVAAGGYFWVYFDSPRRYGNLDTHKIESGLAVPAGIASEALTPIAFEGLPGSATPSRQLWVSAIEIAADGRYVVDRSAPAFYLPGQEVGTNNHRAFSALDPCLERGSSCKGGTDCCSGFCEAEQCVPSPNRCARTEEGCQRDQDCCSASDQCIAGYCSLLVLH